MAKEGSFRMSETESFEIVPILEQIIEPTVCLTSLQLAADLHERKTAFALPAENHASDSFVAGAKWQFLENKRLHPEHFEEYAIISDLDKTHIPLAEFKSKCTELDFIEEDLKQTQDLLSQTIKHKEKYKDQVEIAITAMKMAIGSAPLWSQSSDHLQLALSKMADMEKQNA